MRWSDWYFADQGNLESVRWWTIVVTTVEVATLANVAGATEEPIERYAPDIDIPPPAVLEQARRNLARRLVGQSGPSSF